MESDSYCREIEAHLCRRNGGHLVRVVGPSFEVVSGWAAKGIPLKVALKGIDRYVERYAAKGPRRRPVRIEFCENDVLDVFDEWRRAVGIGTAGGGSLQGSEPEATITTGGERPPADDEAIGAKEAGRARPGHSLREHLDRVVTRLTNVIAQPGISEGVVRVAERIADELSRDRATSRTLRGDARAEFVQRLEVLDEELLQAARLEATSELRAQLEREAAEQLATFRGRMPQSAYEQALAAAVDALLRERVGLPVVAYRT